MRPQPTSVIGGIVTVIIVIVPSPVDLRAQEPRRDAAELRTFEPETLHFFLAFAETGHVATNGKKEAVAHTFVAARGTKYEVINYDTPPESGKKGRYQVIRNFETKQDYSIDYAADKALGTLLLYPPGRLKGALVRADNDLIDLLSLKLFGGIPPASLVASGDGVVRVVPGAAADEFGAWTSEVRREGNGVTVRVAVSKRAGSQFVDVERRDTMAAPGEYWEDRLGTHGRLDNWDEEVTVVTGQSGQPERVDYKMTVTAGQNSYVLDKSHRVTELTYDLPVIDAKIGTLLVPIPDGYTAEVLRDPTAMMWKDGRIVDRIDRRVFDMKGSFWFSPRARLYRVMLTVTLIGALVAYLVWWRLGKRKVTGTA